MKAKLIVEGKEFPIEIHDPELEKLLKPQKKTGYERVCKGSEYHFVDADDTINGYDEDLHNDVDDVYYENANYYSDRTVAENNARADKLMRQLRRFAVEHIENNIDWKNVEQCKYYIVYDYNTNTLFHNYNQSYRGYGAIYFDSNKTAELAIKIFHDELIWYFTEYKDSL